MPDKKVYPLSSVTKSIENIIAEKCNRAIWVRAEIVKLNYYKQSGHCYPDLVEKKDGKIVAELRGNIWNDNFESINRKFKSVLNEELGDNMTVVLLATIKFHSVYGLSLNITDIDPSYTLGELARHKAEAIKKLQDENIFAQNKKTVLPKVPKTIAIISVVSSKGYCDFISVIDDNPWKYKYHYLLFPAILQGDNAINSIISQLNRIEKHKAVFDTVAIIRGGGGEIGLSCYDDYTLAKKIATFPIPVLTGIGHSTNETVAEMVSYQSFITPTKIGEFLLQKYHNFSVPLEESTVKIKTLIDKILEKQKSNLTESGRLFNSLIQNTFEINKSTLKQYEQYIVKFVPSLIRSEKRELSISAGKIQMLTSSFMQYQLNDLKGNLTAVKNASEKIITNQLKELGEFQKSVFMNNRFIIENAQKSLGYIDDKISLLSPANVLKRGFSITRINGFSMRDTNKIKVGDSIETELYEGKISSKVETIKQNKK